MAAASGKVQCFTCDKEKAAYECKGCLRDFCFIHLKEHRQMLSRQLDEIENDHNLFLQTILEEKEHPKKRFINTTN